VRQWLVRIRNGVGTRDKNLCEAQWLACVLLYRRFAAALTGGCARLEVDVVSYSFIVSDLHRLLVAGLPAHCERFWTLPEEADLAEHGSDPAPLEMHPLDSLGSVIRNKIEDRDLHKDSISVSSLATQKTRPSPWPHAWGSMHGLNEPAVARNA
jgi:hypothetical protein